jgi:Flp pilus assembly protein protease CpaA
VGVLANFIIFGWPGCKLALLGAGLGLLLLLPFVALRSLGAGDWKLVGALGAFLGPQRLLLVLFGTFLVEWHYGGGSNRLETASCGRRCGTWPPWLVPY